MGVELNRRQFLSGVLASVGGAVPSVSFAEKGPVEAIPRDWGLEQMYQPKNQGELKGFSLLYFGTADMGLCGSDLDDLYALRGELGADVNLVFIYPNDASVNVYKQQLKALSDGSIPESEEAHIAAFIEALESDPFYPEDDVRDNVHKLLSYEDTPFWIYSAPYERINRIYKEVLGNGWYNLLPKGELDDFYTVQDHTRAGSLISVAGDDLKRYKLGNGLEDTRNKLAGIPSEIKSYCSPWIGSKPEYCL